MPIDFVKSALVTLLVTLDPPGLAPIFIGLTLGMTENAKRQVAYRASVIAFSILAAFAIGGREVLEALGVTIPAFRVSGGLLLLIIAINMIFELRPEQTAHLASRAVEKDHIRNIAAFPLAIPLMAGPGSITATMLLAERAGSDWLSLLSLFVIAAASIALCTLVFLAADRVAGLLGATGKIVLTRMLGVVLAAMAAQFVIDGVTSAFHLG